jgi:hypothetical protein
VAALRRAGLSYRPGRGDATPRGGEGTTVVLHFTHRPAYQMLVACLYGALRTTLEAEINEAACEPGSS